MSSAVAGREQTVFERILERQKSGLILVSGRLGVAAIVDIMPVIEGQVVVFPCEGGKRHLHEYGVQMAGRVMSVATAIGQRMMERFTPKPEVIIYHGEGRTVENHGHMIVAPSYERGDFAAAYDPNRDRTPKNELYVAGIEDVLTFSADETAQLEDELLATGSQLPA